MYVSHWQMSQQIKLISRTKAVSGRKGVPRGSIGVIGGGFGVNTWLLKKDDFSG
jgi:hypothetical protein